jgi:hypothetical protein
MNHSNGKKQCSFYDQLQTLFIHFHQYPFENFYSLRPELTVWYALLYLSQNICPKIFVLYESTYHSLKLELLDEIKIDADACRELSNSSKLLLAHVWDLVVVAAIVFHHAHHALLHFGDLVLSN